MRGASTRMAARVAGGGGWLLDRGAAARGGLMSRVGAAAAAAPARSLSTAGSSGDRRRGGSGGRRGGFWSKWNAATQQEFEQQVSLDGDKRSERRRSPLRQIGREASSLDPRDDYDDLEFALEDALENVQPSPAGAKDAEARSRGTAEAEAMRDALLNDDAVSSRRRSELLSLLDELSPAALLPLPPYPRPDATGAEPGGAADFFGGEDDAAAASLSMVGSFIDSARLRESGALPDGGYFAHVLHTRRVSKVTGAGKKGSISVLAVVGNGNGTAGFGLGKDGEATTALVKACRAAKKRLLHVERFDDRTIFHDIEDKWAKTKVIILLRRAGAGTRCNWTMWKILSAFGIRDVSVKVHGSRNNISQTRALFNALQRMSSAQDVADRRGKRVLDMTPRSSIGQAGFRPD